eukprot:468609-Alexandrium_andersonii.AAC.1
MQGHPSPASQSEMGRCPRSLQGCAVCAGAWRSGELRCRLGFRGPSAESCSCVCLDPPYWLAPLG